MLKYEAHHAQDKTRKACHIWNGIYVFVMIRLVPRHTLHLGNEKMIDCRRIYIPEATYFFTVNLAERQNNNLLIENIKLLGTAFRYVKKRYPFRIDAIVILP